MSLNKRLMSSEAAALVPSENFSVVLYTGNATDDTAITGVGFQPDLVWLKERSAAENHNLTDSSRGTNKILNTNGTGADVTSTSRIKSFDTDGFTLGNNNETNDNNVTYAAYCWKAGGGTTASNSNGSITSTVQANDDAGFSIVKYAGNVTAGATVGHGLSAAPNLIILKNRDRAGYGWLVYHSSIAPTAGIVINTTDAKNTQTALFNDTAATSTVFSLGSDTFGNYSGDNYIAYCWREITGYSKFGTYTGDRTNDVYVETGFEVGWVMIKAADAADDWFIISQETGNTVLYANKDNAEAAFTGVSFLSNGFMLNGAANSGGTNNDGTVFIYAAFAVDPDTVAPALAGSFGITTYTGTGSSQSLIGLGFQPNLVWIKSRSNATSHELNDVLRGQPSRLFSDTNAAAATSANGFVSLDSDGFSVDGTGSGGEVNTSGRTYVGWGWKANDNEPTLLQGSQTFDNIITSNLVLHLNANQTDSYPGSGTSWDDLTSNNNDFTLTGATFDSGDSGSLNFDGTNDYATADSSFATTSGNDITIEFWAKSTSGSQPSYANIIDANHSTAITNSTGSGWVIQQTGGTQNQFYFAYYNGSGYESNSDAALFTLDQDAWTHIAVVKNGTGVQVYKNGIAGTSWTASSATLANPSQIVLIARYANGSSRDFIGKIAQVRLYSSALSAANVLTNYHASYGIYQQTDSIVSVNANAGFSIVKYEGTYPARAQIAHGLSAAPEFIIIKNLNDAADWEVYHTSTGNTGNLVLNETDAFATNAGFMKSVSPTATVFTVGNDGYVNGAGDQHIAYCFHSVTGYSKFGTYTGTAGSFTVTTGFQPDFVMIKRRDGTGNWVMVDSPRASGGTRLYANLSNAEDTGQGETFSSTGFSPRTSSTADTNIDGGNYIYAAFKINSIQADYLVIAGGGGGGEGRGGGGGAGGYIYKSGGRISAGTTYTITVGAGGGNNTSGSNSVFSGAIAIGGGKGGPASVAGNYASGGSGGGGAGLSTTTEAGAAGTAGQGYAGGHGYYTGGTQRNGGGGGGASEVGENASANTSGDGGDGIASSITGSSVTRAGGGGGGDQLSGEGTGGAGGGGNGGRDTSIAATDGTANTGSGGGGGGGTGGTGGSGIVILRLLTSDYTGTTSGSPGVTTDGDYTVLQYTSSGTYTA